MSSTMAADHDAFKKPSTLYCTFSHTVFAVCKKIQNDQVVWFFILFKNNEHLSSIFSLITFNFDKNINDWNN